MALLIVAIAHNLQQFLMSSIDFKQFVFVHGGSGSCGLYCSPSAPNLTFVKVILAASFLWCRSLSVL